jgi:hypothetical protein
MSFLLIGLQPARASRLKRRADDAKKQLVPDGCEHTLARLDDVHIPGALSAKLREAWQYCYYLPSYLRILVSPLESWTKRHRLYTEVQDSQATGLLPTKTLHTGCLSDSGVCTAESTPSIRSNCFVHLSSAPNSCGTLLVSTCGLKTTGARCNSTLLNKSDSSRQ